ncbi:hypothetical protein EMIHUDRAFT_118068 [Emiliania huxleyi CCMP1516]|uniref:Uncharacterized protein n=2 Tax=Emiliania huxleyi TaxID=2903 RepID=A0A0D3J6W3_EMIH1|nr:hypothetical protein EMIHUDRAFT_118068 [Emiliania huxleyi CCMP1516]EOD19248.1 hypothetical protein EMIHUDRAFT_118068 [Emiliania huxleyi CCMP1516]|eukprot:XP_005771677.1 hypothetical protein EMIHUDRAFT_118068 [Emiliania huxleyi CCMP1516]
MESQACSSNAARSPCSTTTYSAAAACSTTPSDNVLTDDNLLDIILGIHRICGDAWDSRRSVSHSLLRTLDSQVITYADGGAGAAARAEVALCRFPALRELRIRGLDDLKRLLPILASRHCAQAWRLPHSRLSAGLPSLGLPSVAPHGRMVRLELSGCGALTDSDLESLAEALPQLEELQLSCNAQLVRPRLGGLRRLRVAALYICASLQDGAVDDLCRGSPLLRELSVWRCSALRRPSLAAPQLKQLNVSECFELTEEALVGALRRWGEMLRSLIATGCDGRLSHLKLAGCAALLDAALERACVRSPRPRKLAVAPADEIARG